MTINTITILELPASAFLTGAEWFPFQLVGGTTQRAQVGQLMMDNLGVQTANRIFAGPASGAAAAASFRALVAADIPAAAITLTIGSTVINSGTSGRVLYDNAGVVGELAVTGTGNVVLATSPALTTPNIGTPSAGVLTNCTGLPIASGVSGLGTGIATALAVNTGSAGAPVLFNGALGTPSSGTLTNATGLPISTGVAGLGTGIAAALAINTGSAGAPVLFNGALGTPSSGALTNCTGLPLTTGITGILGPANGGTGVANNAASTLTISGNFATTLTVSGVTGVTLPTSGTLATLAGTEELDNKTLDSSVGKGTWTASGTWTLPALTLGGTVSGGGQQLNNIIIGTVTPLAGAFTTLAASTSATVTSASAVALAIGLNGATNPAFTVDASTGSQVAGLKITGAVTGGTVALVATDSGSNTNLTLNAKGSGTIGIGTVSTGAVTITPALTLSTAPLTLTGGQIAFPAIQNPSANANTLDDYEEGTWTPVLTFATPGDLSVAYTLQLANYTKVGRLVTVAFTILTSTFTHTTAAGALRVTGLPFTSVSGGPAYLGGAHWQGINKAGFTQIGASLNANAALVSFFAYAMGSTATEVVVADVPSGGTVIVAATLVYAV